MTSEQKYDDAMSKVDGLEFRVIPEYKYSNGETGEDGIKVENKYVLQLLIGNLPNVEKRKPINLCIALDTSGSMAGSKLTNCKMAIQELISQLGDDDIISLITYDSVPKVCFSNKFKKDDVNIRSEIKKLNANGLTDIFSALKLSVQHLVSCEEKNYERIVFLFSDGCVTSGESDINVVGKQLLDWKNNEDVRFSTFGIGDDFNEDWMRSLARSGDGNYQFIDNVEHIPRLITKAFNAFTDTVAQDATIRITGNHGSLLTEFDKQSACPYLVSGKTYGKLRKKGFYEFGFTVDQTNYDDNSKPFIGIGFDCTSLHPKFPSKQWVKITNVHQPLPDIKNIFDKTEEYQRFDATKEVGELNLKVNVCSKNGDQQGAVANKTAIIQKFVSVLPFDRFGFIQAQLDRENIALNVLNSKGCRSNVFTKSHNKAGYHGMSQAALSKSSYNNMQSYEMCDDEDEDMGFGLFD